MTPSYSDDSHSLRRLTMSPMTHIHSIDELCDALGGQDGAGRDDHSDSVTLMIHISNDSHSRQWFTFTLVTHSFWWFTFSLMNHSFPWLIIGVISTHMTHIHSDDSCPLRRTISNSDDPESLVWVTFTCMSHIHSYESHSLIWAKFTHMSHIHFDDSWSLRWLPFILLITLMTHRQSGNLQSLFWLTLNSLGAWRQ